MSARLALILLLPAFACAQAPAAAPLPYVDAHVHPLAGSLEEPLAVMQEAGIRAMVLILHPGGGLDPQWRAVLEEFADRFVLGGDQFFAAGLPGSGPGIEFSRFAPIQRRQQAMLLSLLPADVARRIGYENAVRLYKLQH